MEVAKRNAPENRANSVRNDVVLDALCAAAEHDPLELAWIPHLSEPDDEPLPQMAVEAEVAIPFHQLRVFALRCPIRAAAATIR